MRKFIFSYTDELECVYYIDGEKIKFSDGARELLINNDIIDFKKVQIKNNELVLLSSEIKLIIKNLDKMLENDILSYFYHNLDKINKAFAKHTKNKKIIRGASFGFASVGTLAAVFIAMNTGKIKDYSTSNNIISSIEDSMDNNKSKVGTLVDKYYKVIEENLNNTQNKEEEKCDIADNPNEYDEMLEGLDNSNVVCLPYDIEIEQEKVLNVYDNYYDIIVEQASKWGVSPTLIQSMITQESGGYLTNLMQIQFNAWAGDPITLYNFEKGQYETILLTNHPENYVREPNTQYITEKDLENPKINISVGCIILQYSFERMQRNILATIQCYNFGTKNMKTVLEAAANDTGLSVDEILSEQNNLSWLEYRSVIPGEDGKYGDRKYLENVFRFIPEDKLNDIYIYYIDEKGEVNQENIIVENANLSL